MPPVDDTAQTPAAPPAAPATAPAAPPAAPAAPAAAPPAEPNTLLGQKPTDVPPAAPATWPEDWRTKVAAGDEKLGKVFERYSSPEDVAKALVAAQRRLTSGELRSTLPKDATPEQLAAWRQENGIPDSPEGYDLSQLPGGLTIGEADKPLIEAFVKDMHGANASPELVKSAIASYYRLQEQQAGQLAQQDATVHQRAEDELRREWGNDYRVNVNAMTALLDAAPAGVKEGLLGARLADGTLLGDNPTVLRWLAGMAREMNPVATVMPGSGANAMQAMSDEIASIEKTMREDPDKYWKGESGAQMQARYRQLVDARDKARA